MSLGTLKVIDMKQTKLKHTKNIYFAFKENGTTLEYKILVNIEENNKAKVYELEKEGYKVTKVLANEGGI